MKKVTVFLICLLIGLQVFANGSSEKDSNQKEREILFTTMNYGDVNSWQAMWQKMADQFYAETNIKVKHEIINWAQAREKITTWHVGGDAPDVIDMFWSKTYSELGAGKFGTRPIEEYIDKYIPDYYEKFQKSAISDVENFGHIYGIPWRIDVRPMVYRKDFLEQAGIDPNSIVTWDDLLEAGKKLTITDSDGKITRYGVGFLYTDAPQQLYTWLWQAGGAFMNDTYDKATIDTPAAKEALEMLYRMVNIDHIASGDLYKDPSYDPIADFVAGNAAIVPSAPTDIKTFIERNAPQLKDVVVAREPLKNKTQDAFQGAGYFTPTYQCDDMDAAMQWLAFISRPENMLEMSKVSNTLTPCVPALQDPYFNENWWFSGQIKALPYGRTTQHPNTAWGAITNRQPGSPIYDMMVSVMNDESSIDDALKTCQKRMTDLIEEVK
ncbi:extracellular solute-binding protein [uncultured Sphaerochaeta sp.]|uniref:extracellular solute-binding protein n=1 Tax=uncultured Sphaerochaeta sp. TaxID=886478 RepID=UPI002AA932D6|nr:extracellular solute-binding protein [uncultured Sphaerochaeta sp.]